MKVTYRITEDDFVEALALHQRRSHWPLILSAIIAAILLLVSSQRFPVTFWTAGLCLLLIVYFAVSRYVWVPERRRRHYRASGLGARTFALRLLDDGIHFMFSGGERMLRWGEVFGWRAGRRCVLLYSSVTQFQVIPKSVEKEGFDLQALLVSLERRVGKPL